MLQRFLRRLSNVSTHAHNIRVPMGPGGGRYFEVLNACNCALLNMSTYSTASLAVVGGLLLHRLVVVVVHTVRRVLITPLDQTSKVTPAPHVLGRVLMKAVTKTGKKKDKIFTLRNIETVKISSCEKLKRLIKLQLHNDVIDWEEFDVGYINSKRTEKVISVRSKEDLAEMWKEVRAHGDKVQLWCDGLKVDSSTGGQSQETKEDRFRK